ncbi:arylsulfatase [Okeania hirsuta]|uniref:Arylsulfatase n=3 Tax=Microcoleaceae TaxID=1892252 RepID=A0A3N6NRR6_9CYAN|nr:arylsulfatase [Okeania sp. SIO1F9]RQH12212.1 arylsulfatase [Okeania hirsuta]RQH30674.1 arylsulfatase [Okeania hirsuta]
MVRGVVAFTIATSLILTTTVPPVMAQQILPHPDAPFSGKVGLTTDANDSVADDLQLKLPSNFGIENAPNILVVMLDDVGYGQFGTFGSPITTIKGKMGKKKEVPMINTPAMDRVADNGLRYTKFHTTAMCSPTRAALLTGRNHHSVATGALTNGSTGYPGYNSIIPQNAATFAKVLQAYGYGTAWFGKNHNVPEWEVSEAGPFEHWPTGLGFDYFYGFIGGDVDQYHPPIIENTTRVIPPATNADGTTYHFNTDLADHAINYIKTQKALIPEKPFLAYFATGATHAPHQVPQKWLDKYDKYKQDNNGESMFSMGWDKFREKTFERQKTLGVIPKDAQLTPRPEDDLPAWDSLTTDEQALYARMMEVYAAFTEQTDEEIGRVIDAIEEIGELDNTMIIYIAGDNGASAEGDIEGLVNELTFFNKLDEPFEDKLAAMDTLGGEMHYNHFPAAWAWAMDTPFQWTKQIASHFGGTRNAMAISWPARIKDIGTTRYQFSHVIDIFPTILEAVGIPAPVKVNGVDQKPIEGTSLVYTFDDATAPTKHTTQYFEMVGNQGIYHNGWMASAIRGVPWADENPDDIDVLHMNWELYNIDKDFSQAKDLAARRPKKLDEMIKLFYAEASKYNVFPLDDRKFERFDESLRPTITGDRKTFTYPDHFRTKETTAPNMKGKDHSITADVDFETGDEGVLLTVGGRFGGFGLFIKDEKLVYLYNLAGIERYEIPSTEPLPTGNVTFKAEYITDSEEPGAGATVTLYANGNKIGTGRLEETLKIKFSNDGTFDVGFDTGTPVIDDEYEMPFDFTGTLNNVEVKLLSEMVPLPIFPTSEEMSSEMEPIPTSEDMSNEDFWDTIIQEVIR